MYCSCRCIAVGRGGSWESLLCPGYIKYLPWPDGGANCTYKKKGPYGVGGSSAVSFEGGGQSRGHTDPDPEEL